METKTKPIKQRKIKQNSKQALEFLKSKNPNLEQLINVFDLELAQTQSNSNLIKS